MRWALFMWLCFAVASACVCAPAAPATAAQKVVDGIAAYVEDDVITLSELQELAAYQQLVDGKSEPIEQLLSERIEQWIVNNEAATAQFPAASEADVNREIARIEERFPNSQAYNQRLSELGITPNTVRRIVAQQIYFAKYLDYKFRASVQVDDAAIAMYYSEHLVPEMSAKNQTPPPLSSVTEQIRELLITQRINDRVNAWFEDTKPRLKIQTKPLPQIRSMLGQD